MSKYIKYYWNLFFVFGVFLGGIVTALYFKTEQPIVVDPNLVNELSGYGITDVYTKTLADAKFVYKTGDTMTGQLNVPSLSATGNITANTINIENIEDNLVVFLKYIFIKIKLNLNFKGSLKKVEICSITRILKANDLFCFNSCSFLIKLLKLRFFTE